MSALIGTVFTPSRVTVDPVVLLPLTISLPPLITAVLIVTFAIASAAPSVATKAVVTSNVLDLIVPLHMPHKQNVNAVAQLGSTMNCIDSSTNELSRK